jgi:hypothetical protein
VAFEWDENNWNGFDKGKPNNNGATKEQVQVILTRSAGAQGDGGLIEALTQESSSVKILKGIHQEDTNLNPHITVQYSGGVWHVNLKTTAVQGPAGYRVSSVKQWK